MAWRGQVWAFVVVFAAAFGAASCASDDAIVLYGGEGLEEQSLGRLHLPLVTPSSERYRLSNAVFQIVDRSGSPALTLRSDDNPDALALDADLRQDTYSITLEDNWVLSRLADDGTATPVRAALLTPNPTSFEIENGSTRELVYSFTTTEGVVSFGEGSLRISVDVAPSASLPGCSLLPPSGCPDGQTCLLADDTGGTFCASPGTLPVGAACTSENCVAGSQCLRLDPAQPDAGVCTRFCNPATSFCGCQSLSFDADVGVCTQAVTGVAFSHTFNGEPGGGGTAACNEWNAFRAQLVDRPFDRVTINGSLGAPTTCGDPAAATQICNALGNSSAQVFCEGRTWLTGAFCGSGPEINVNGGFCNCSSNRTVRPCQFEFGGVGVNSCDNVPQTLEVICE